MGGLERVRLYIVHANMMGRLTWTALAEQAAVSQATKARGMSIVNTENQSVAARYGVASGGSCMEGSNRRQAEVVCRGWDILDHVEDISRGFIEEYGPAQILQPLPVF